jgi:hypothetical protein
MTQPKFEPSIKALEKVFEGDTDLLLFYLSWLKNGLNAGKAYKELHPEITEGSSDTLGSRMLSKVEKGAVLQAYKLDIQKYFTQLKEGLDATKWNDFTGEREADHKTRQAYHDKLGRLIGLEERLGSKIDVNIDNRSITFIGSVEQNKEIDEFVISRYKELEREGKV